MQIKAIIWLKYLIIYVLIYYYIPQSSFTRNVTTLGILYIILFRFAKIPDEPVNRLGVKSESSSSGSSSESSSDSEDSGEEERRAKLKLLEQELIAMQEKMRKLVEESTTKKKAKKKSKEKHPKKGSTANNMAKLMGHGAATKANSLLTDNIGASIASVASGAGDVKLPADAHHPLPSKNLQHMHMTTPANANSAKPAKSKGKLYTSIYANNAVKSVYLSIK